MSVISRYSTGVIRSSISAPLLPCRGADRSRSARLPCGRMKTCLGIDVGGTFTDAVLTDGTTTWRAKAPTTPGRLGDGVLAAARLVADRSGRTLEALLPTISRFGLGTTAVTNTLAARTGRRVGLLTTSGFEGMLRFAQGTRVIDEDGWLALPPQVVPRSSVAAVHERIDRDGQVVVPLDPAEVVGAVQRLVDDEHVEVIAVSYLWSFLNPVHETLTAEAIGEVYPGLPVVCGAALHPAIREYERTTYAVLNAYVVVGAASGSDDLVTCDMGGTSFDVSVVEGGRAARRTRGRLMGVWTALSLVDVESIGAGGGSLGWVDARGMLRVGPRSAGAVPGPACYGRGGTDATVTDALVVLGFIDPQRFLGGDFELDPAAAQAACARLGSSLGLGAEETAWGVRQIALAGMVKATRARLAALGLDPRDHAILSFGGSGSLFTVDIAAAIGARRVLVPELASVLSAFGAATTDVRRERVRAVLATMPVDVDLVQKLMGELATGVDDDLAADGVVPADRSVQFEADLRFAKQIFELSIPVTGPRFDDAARDRLLDDFRGEYAKRYGQGSIVLGAPIELVSLRAIGIGRTVHATLDGHGAAGVPAGTQAPAAGTRSVRVARSDLVDVAVHAGAELRPGHTLTGPALVDGSDTTIWVPAGSHAHVDPHGTLIVEVGQ